VTLESDIYLSDLSFICPASSGEQTITGVSIGLCVLQAISARRAGMACFKIEVDDFTMLLTSMHNTAIKRDM